MRNKYICIYIMFVVLLLFTACSQHPGYESESIDITIEAPDKPESIDTTVEAPDEPEFPDPLIIYQDGTLNLRIIDSDTRLPLPFAMVFIDCPDDPYITTANIDGTVTLVKPPGSYTIVTYLKGYLPDLRHFQILGGSVLDAAIALETGELICASITTKQLSFGEITTKGIDIFSPLAQHTWGIEATMDYQLALHPGRNSGRNSSGNTNSPEGAGAAAASIFLRTNNSASFNKDVFEIQVILKNMTEPQLSLINGTIELDLPEGLSLAEKIGQQSSEITTGTIYGHDEVSYSWIVYGNNEGDFDITVNYTGTLMPFDETVEKVFITETPVVVSETGWLRLNLLPFSAAIPNAPYYIPFEFKNESDKILDLATYRFNGDLVSHDKNAEILKQQVGRDHYFNRVDEMKNIGIFSAGDRIIIRRLYPGEEVKGIYKTWFNNNANLNKSYFELQNTTAHALENSSIDVPVMFEPTHIEISSPSSNTLRLLEDFIVNLDTGNLVDTNTLFNTNENGDFRLSRGANISREHYNFNKTLDFSRCGSACKPDCQPALCVPKPGFANNGLIIHQTIGVPGEVRMGRASLGSNACGWVAVYNTFLVSEMDINNQHPAEIVRWIERNNALVLDGRFGTNPAAFDRLFSDWGIDSFTTFASQGIFDTPYLDIMAQSSSSSIINYINRGGISSGIHNVTVVWDDTENEFVFYNAGGRNESRPVRRPSIAAFLRDNADSLISITQIFD